MKKLDLKFIDNKHKGEFSPYERILHTYGKEICKYAEGYFNYIVTTTSKNGVITDASLYIIVNEIDYDYKVLALEQVDIENVKASFFTLKTRQTEISIESTKDGYLALENKLSSWLSSRIANETFKFLINQVLIKRENRD